MIKLPTSLACLFAFCVQGADTTGEELTRLLHLSSTGVYLTTNDLTWTPQRKGVSVLVQPRPRTPYLMVTLTLSPEAVTNLLNEKDPQITFHFPNLKSVSLDFFSRPEPSADKTKAGKGQ